METEEGWRTGNDDEWEKLLRGIVTYIRAQRIKWWGHLNRMEETKTTRKIMERDRIGMRSEGRPKNRWGDTVLNDLKTLRVKDWTYLVKDRTAWYELVQKIKSHKGL